MSRIKKASKSLVEYVGRILRDYKDAVVEVKDGAIQKPIKALIVTGVVGGLIYLADSNPNERCFLDQLVNSQNDLIEVSEQLRNQSSLQHVLHLNKCRGARDLKRLNLGFLSFLYRLDRNSDCALYINQCEYLKPSLKSCLTERLIDVGVAGKWWILSHKMFDYDVNSNEWS
ncbi:mitochondrial import inner membrane translocase subunit Tim29 [Brevipalpus obovatus]|uniref:mitochondrial import inner membrane translocase subunit Tim29 n=1 Tax=Brevipalpus obovatus TaxID=246614 RepID=UPI003D9E6FDD